MRRALIWLLTLPFAAASILAGHGAAYALTGAAPDAFHGYLEHAPQVVAVLALLGLLGLAREGRARSTSFVPVAALAAAGFTCQEHLERVLHTGELPLLLTSPAFWLGLALQLPFAAVVWLVARRIARSRGSVTRARPPRLALLPLVLHAARVTVLGARPAGVAIGRSPPLPS